MATSTSTTRPGPTFLQLMACDAKLRVDCLDCGRISVPILGKVALRVGMQAAMDDAVVIRCAHCGSAQTKVTIQYPSDFGD